MTFYIKSSKLGQFCSWLIWWFNNMNNSDFSKDKYLLTGFFLE